jgi:hypothetical protein
MRSPMRRRRIRRAEPQAPKPSQEKRADVAASSPAGYVDGRVDRRKFNQQIIDTIMVNLILNAGAGGRIISYSTWGSYGNGRPQGR